MRRQRPTPLAFRGLRDRPYLIAAALVVLIAYLVMLYIVATQPASVMPPMVKVTWLSLLLLIPGKCLLEGLRGRFRWSDKITDRLARMGFFGTLIGLFQTAEAAGPLPALATFLIWFTVVGAVIYLIDVIVDTGTKAVRHRFR